MQKDFNQQVIDEFRANAGKVGGWFEGSRLLLLTTTGARSGKPHTAPVGYLPDGDQVLVIASAGGAPHHPAWYHNLVAHPEVTVEDGTFTYQATSRVLHGTERDQLFARAVEADRGWAEYQAKTDRVIPVIALREIPGPPRFNATFPGAAIKAVHDAFRRELALIREEIATAGPGLGAQLRVNCLTLCQGLHNHHTGEDMGLFPALEQQHPSLAPVLRRLDEEHQRVAALTGQLQQLLSGQDAGLEAGATRANGTDARTLGGADELGTEFDRLATELEAHLAYEEKELIPLLEGREGP